MSRRRVELVKNTSQRFGQLRNGNLARGRYLKRSAGGQWPELARFLLLPTAIACTRATSSAIYEIGHLRTYDPKAKYCLCPLRVKRYRLATPPPCPVLPS
jgi:hypothetical protein